MQKTISIMIIMVMTVFPMLSALASASQCHQTSKLDSPSATSKSATNHTNNLQMNLQMSDMDSQHGCCEKPETPCSHGEQCDCDTGQAGSSLVNDVASVLQTHDASTFKRAIHTLLISRISDSLYRPPILIL